VYVWNLLVVFVITEYETEHGQVSNQLVIAEDKFEVCTLINGLLSSISSVITSIFIHTEYHVIIQDTIPVYHI